MSLQHIILGLLKTDGEKSGYDLNADFEGGMGTFWYCDLSQIYRALTALEENGWVRGRPDPDNARNRKVYAITPAGEDELIAWLRKDFVIPQFRRRDLVKVFFGHLIPNEQLHVQFVALRTEYDRRLSAIRASIPIVEGLRDQFPGEAPYWLMTINQGLKIMQAQIEWCDDCLKMLDQLN